MTHAGTKSKKMWGGRFNKPVHPLFESFSSSLADDCLLAPYDIEATKAHCLMLRRIRILSSAEMKKITKGLDGLRKDLPKYQGLFLSKRFEDIHSFIESEMIRRAGPGAKKIHTARSRNDQVNQATRMYCKATAGRIAQGIRGFQLELIRQCEKNQTVFVPGYTHLQKAQVISVAHQFLSYVEMLDRSYDQIQDALKRIDVLALGSGALAGTTVPIDRNHVRISLGFAKLSSNSLDVAGNRDFVAEILFAYALLGTHLSRIAEDLLIGQLDEKSWFDLPEELCTGSSMMPQKKNPDFLELARGGASILIGNVVSMMTVLKGLPGSYNRDLQWDKRPLFESTRIATDVIELFTDLFRGLRVNKASAGAGLSQTELCATDLAEALVMNGMPFRKAHEVVGRLVRYASDEGTALLDVPPQKVMQILGVKLSSWKKLLDPKTSALRKRGYGSCRPREVAKQIARWKRVLK